MCAVYPLCVWFMKRPEEVNSPGTGELPCRSWKSHPGALEEQNVLLITEPHPQHKSNGLLSIKIIFWQSYLCECTQHSRNMAVRGHLQEGFSLSIMWVQQPSSTGLPYWATLGLYDRRKIDMFHSVPHHDLSQDFESLTVPRNKSKTVPFPYGFGRTLVRKQCKTKQEKAWRRTRPLPCSWHLGHNCSVNYAGDQQSTQGWTLHVWRGAWGHGGPPCFFFSALCKWVGLFHNKYIEPLLRENLKLFIEDISFNWIPKEN